MIFIRQNKKIKRTNLTPLIDVIFLLIVFFMLSSRFTDLNAINLSISSIEQTNTKENNTQDNLTILTITRSGEININNQDINLSVSEERLHDVLPKNQDIAIKAENGVTVQNIVRIIDKIKSLGNNNISLLQEGDENV